MVCFSNTGSAEMVENPGFGDFMARWSKQTYHSDLGHKGENKGMMMSEVEEHHIKPREKSLLRK